MSLSDSLNRLYWRAERAIAPGVRYSQYHYEAALTQHIPAGAEWLDVGCGHQVLPAWRRHVEQVLVSRCRRVVGIDRDLPSLRHHPSITERVYGDMRCLPFPDDSFDVVTANMVVEHLDDPAAQFAEVRRVLRPGGVFIFHTPNALGYATQLARLVPETVKSSLARVLDGRKAGDVFPTYYRANSEAALRALARQAGFEVSFLNLIVGSAVMARVLPLALVELVWMRVLTRDRFRQYRTNIIAGLRKPAAAEARRAAAS